MRKIMTAAVVLVGVATGFGCKTRTAELQEQREEVAQKEAQAQERFTDLREEAGEEKAEISREANEERAEVTEDVNEERAEVMEDVNEERRELAEEEAEFRGTGGSGEAYAPRWITGTLKGSAGSGFTLMDTQGGEMRFDTNDRTRIMHNGAKADLDNFKEGTEVRASYVIEDDDKVARDVEVTKPLMK